MQRGGRGGGGRVPRFGSGRGSGGGGGGGGAGERRVNSEGEAITCEMGEA